MGISSRRADMQTITTDMQEERKASPIRSMFWFHSLPWDGWCRSLGLLGTIMKFAVSGKFSSYFGKAR